MKYHYQYVSKSSVRIELIPEDPKEKALLTNLYDRPQDSEALTIFFQAALDHYKTGSVLSKCNFMNFPTVALCSYGEIVLGVEKVA